MRLACQRHLRDLDTGAARGLTFDVERALHAIEFFPRFLRLHEGAFAGQPFLLQPPLAFIVGSLFGWLGADGFRRFRTAFVEMGKGNAKSPLAGGLALYALVADDEPGAEIYTAAVTRDQAKICFTDAVNMAKASPKLAARLEIGVSHILDPVSGSVLRPVSSEARALDGKRVHFAAIDEVQEHPTPLVVDKMRAGTKGRRQGLIFEITNAGYDPDSVCWHQHEYSVKIVEGQIDNDAWFAYVCALDKGDDPFKDERCWIKANPMLGYSVTEKYIREQVEEARGMPSKRNIVSRLNFCIWTEQHSAWLDMERWAAITDQVPDADLAGLPAFAGLDLGLSDDFSAFVRIFLLLDGRVAVRCRFWVPKSAVTKFKFRPYDQWREAGVLTVTEGDITDYDQVEREVADLARESGIREIAYDKRFAQQMALHLEGKGLTMVDTPQGYELNEALVKLADLVVKGQLCHGDDPILTWMAGNAIVRHGMRQEIRLDKYKGKDKVDGIAALAMALSRAIVHPGHSIYEERGLAATGP